MSRYSRSEHEVEAFDCLDAAEATLAAFDSAETATPDWPEINYWVARAQVHATLAAGQP